MKARICLTDCRRRGWLDRDRGPAEGNPEPAGRFLCDDAAEDTAHGDMLDAADGYVTAWLLWRLQGNGEAQDVFEGPDAVVLSNPAYQDQDIRLD